MDHNNFFIGNIEKITIDNTAYRNVLFTTLTQQLVVMSLLPKEEIGAEVHPNTTQFIRIESGRAIAILNGKEYILNDNDAIVIPASVNHNIINASSDKLLKLYTIYSPPEHKPDTYQQTKLNNKDNENKSDYLILCKYKIRE